PIRDLDRSCREKNVSVIAASCSPIPDRQLCSSTIRHVRSVIKIMIANTFKSDFLGGKLLISVESEAGGCRNSAAIRADASPGSGGRIMKAGRRKGRKVGKPRGKTCRWTAELDEVLK